VYFGGGGSWHLPSMELDWSNVSVIIEFHTLANNNNLDALFSHYNSSASQFTLQNQWDTDVVRWSCGQPGSDTIEVSGAMTDGIIGVSGVNLYKEGSLVGSVPESGEAVQDIQFVLGAIQTDNHPNTQYMRGTVKRIILVKRRLTDKEQAQITLNMKNCDKPSGQLLDNFEFDCGKTGWYYHPSYPAVITDNGDGSVHLKS
jgi:hypothetical protein